MRHALSATLETSAAVFTSDVVNDNVKGKGHDRALCTGWFAGIADGATPLAETWPQNVGEFAASALAALCEAARDETASAPSIFRRAIAEVSRAFDVEEPLLSTGIAVVRVRGAELEVATLGDCGAVLLTEGGPVQLQDFTLTRLDAAARAQPQARLMETVLRNRRLLNSPDGYWAFARSEAAADHLVVHRVAADTVTALLLYTDGYYRLVDPYGLAASAEDLMRLAETDLETSVRQLRAHEAATGGQHSRLTAPDDATAVLLRRRNPSCTTAES